MQPVVYVKFEKGNIFFFYRLPLVKYEDFFHVMSKENNFCFSVRFLTSIMKIDDIESPSGFHV